jgi:hypothetical protein
LVAAIEPDAFRIVALEGVMPTTRGSAVRVGDGPNWSQFAFFPKMFFRTRWNYVDHRKFSEQRLYRQGGEALH